MLDLGLTKMALISVVALVVLGPERLPRVARTAGALFGRAQRYINDVKAEVSREIELDELRRVKTEFEQAAQNVEKTVQDNLRKQETELNEAFGGGTSVSPGAVIGAQTTATSSASTSGTASTASTASAGTSSFWRSSNAGARPAKRKNWRVKQAAAPKWYKRETQRRTRVQSGAARVAQHTPASLRRPVRFF
ncbi:MAG: Sec-independent protein translocase subunit TatB [Paraburkholderia sp.]|uniref:Sec-independent protein translocase protein TatB n=1 Tax=Paraburkholderia sp. TaxID=1926495 RepID=UPI00121BB1BD|nr:Sec-independent protein translocase protein TatB [Paraburkholderia sp.]TAM01096.1 MAG: Sec-independent protein translocase subunit TatB [Paraburkholderia sp.]TAM30370.1 MAG: Sec-independent protein translocase subunit TatB [Paraburkholderia sp.]